MNYDTIRIVIIIIVIFVVGSILSLLFIRVQFVPVSYQSYWMYLKVSPLPPTVFRNILCTCTDCINLVPSKR
jgi:hypothetical protein